MMLVGLTSVAWSQQTDSSVTRSLMAAPEALMAPQAGPLLDARELESKKWYHSVEEALSDPTNVYKLSLTDMKLKELPESLFRLVNLQVLNLSDNKLKTVPSQISKLQNLQVLVLTDNKVNSLPAEMKELDHLVRLYLGRNRLMEMPAWVGGLGKLRYLDLSRNYVTLYDLERSRARLRNCEIVF
jgi:hypothetical protein